MSSSTVNSSPQMNKRWTRAEDIFFVGLLYEVLQSDAKRSEKSTTLKLVLESCKAQLEANFPGTKWTYQRIRSRYDLIKSDYLAYQAALKMSDSVEVIATGKIRLSREQMVDLEVSYPKAAIRMLKNGLRVSGNVTVDTYHQIFSRDTHTGGIYIVKGQQDVTPYDKPSLSIASGNDKSTMADYCTAQSLSKLPTEVLSMIGSYLSHHELRVVTLLSKQFRDIFLAQLFTKIQFSGDLAKLGQRLRSFLSGLKTEWTRIVKCRPRYAIFVVLETELEKYPTASENSPVALIGKFLKEMSDLEGVIFDIQLENREQINRFNCLLKQTEKWTSPCSAIFESADISNYKAILNHFSSETLKAVQLPTRSRKSYYDELKRSCSSLKALHVYTRKTTQVLQLARCMDDPVIRWIKADFPYIESLVLDQNIAYRSCRNPNDKRNVDLFDSYCHNLAALLNKMLHLRRFSFKLWRCQLDETLVRRDRSESPKIQRLTDSEIDNWYTTLVRSLLMNLPLLEELCISDDYRSSCRGTRLTNAEKMVKIEWFRDSDNGHRFPNKLIR